MTRLTLHQQMVVELCQIIIHWRGSWHQFMTGLTLHQHLLVKLCQIICGLLLHSPPIFMGKGSDDDDDNDDDHEHIKSFKSFTQD